MNPRMYLRLLYMYCIKLINLCGKSNEKDSLKVFEKCIIFFLCQLLRQFVTFFSLDINIAYFAGEKVIL